MWSIDTTDRGNTNRICYPPPIETEKFQPEGQREMSEMRFTDFPAISIDPRVGISQSVSESDV